MVRKRDDRPPWVPRVEKLLASGGASYRRAAETIVAAMAADTNLTQRMVAAHIDRDPAWVSRLLKWFREGCPEVGVFAEESRARRELRRRNSQPWLSDPKTGEVIVDGSREPRTAVVLDARRMCERAVPVIEAVTPEAIAGAFEGSGTLRRDAIEGLAQGLAALRSAVDAALVDLAPPEDDAKRLSDDVKNRPLRDLANDPTIMEREVERIRALLHNKKRGGRRPRLASCPRCSTSYAIETDRCAP